MRVNFRGGSVPILIGTKTWHSPRCDCLSPFHSYPSRLKLSLNMAEADPSAWVTGGNNILVHEGRIGVGGYGSVHKAYFR